MKKLRVIAFILIIAVVLMLFIVNVKNKNTYAATETKTITEGDIEYEYELDASSSKIINLRIKSYSGSSTVFTVPKQLDSKNVISIGNGTDNALGPLKDTCTEININNGQLVETINDNAFKGSTSLQKITLKYGLKTIGNSAFYGCTKLATIKSEKINSTETFDNNSLPYTLETIGNSAFEGCISLTQLDQRRGMRNIGERAFYGCTGFTEIGAMGFRTITVGSNVPVGEEFKVGYDAYRFGGRTSSDTNEVTVTVEQSVEKTSDYENNGIAKVTMNLESKSEAQKAPKDYIIGLDTTESMKSRMETAKKSIQKIADAILAENTENRIAIVTSPSDSLGYLYLNFTDSSDTITKAITALKVGSAKGDYGEAGFGPSGFSATANDNTCYTTPLYTMANAIMARKDTNKAGNTVASSRNVYAVFISDGAPTTRGAYIQEAREHLYGMCDAIWAIGIQIANEETKGVGKLESIATEINGEKLFSNFQNLDEVEAYIENIQKQSILSVNVTNLKSTLNTTIWDFYTGTDYANSSGLTTNQSDASVTVGQVEGNGSRYKAVLLLYKLKRLI